MKNNKKDEIFYIEIENKNNKKYKIYSKSKKDIIKRIKTITKRPFSKLDLENMLFNSKHGRSFYA